MALGFGAQKGYDLRFIDPSRNPSALARWKSDMAASRGGTGIIANRWYDAKKHYFTDPKLNRIRTLFLAGNLAQIFKEFPRGAPNKNGVNTITGGRLVAADMPGVDPGSKVAKDAWNFWTRTNATGKPINFSAMNVRRSGNNIVPASKISVSTIHDFYDNYLIFKSDWICMPVQIEELKNEAYSGQLATDNIQPVELCAKPPVDKLKQYAMTVAMIVAFYYVGPMIMQGVGAATGGVIGTGAGAGAGASAAGTAVQTATTFQRIQATTSTFLGYVNKARTIKAIVEGKLPPPPISIQGASFREWAFIIAKKEIKDAAIDYALEKGVDYVAKKMAKKEEAKLRKEIAEMQRQLIAMTPKAVLDAPPEPSPLLPKPIQRMQQIEIAKKEVDDKTLTTILAAAIPLIVLTKGA